MLSAHRSAVESARAVANRTTTLRVGMPQGVNPAFLLAACDRFCAGRPGVTLVPVARKRSAMPRALMNGEIDLYMDIGRAADMPFKTHELFAVEQYCVVGKTDALATFASVGPQQLAARTLGVWESPERYAALAGALGLPGPDAMQNLHRDLSAALSLCMTGGVLVTSLPVVQMLKSTLAVVPLDFDCGIVYAAVSGPAENPLVNEFIACAREVAGSEDNPWRRAR